MVSCHLSNAARKKRKIIVFFFHFVRVCVFTSLVFQGLLYVNVGGRTGLLKAAGVDEGPAMRGYERVAGGVVDRARAWRVSVHGCGRVNTFRPGQS